MNTLTVIIILLVLILVCLIFLIIVVFKHHKATNHQNYKYYVDLSNQILKVSDKIILNKFENEKI